MPLQPRTHTRDELYAKVLSKPVRDVAAEFGVSDVALAKACRKLIVPLPARGYWGRRTPHNPLEKRVGQVFAGVVLAAADRRRRPLG